ncbi:uncharacterized protein C16orf78 homolog [Nannospalax galili]|uniref:uncharacterized protein C16orf78 homolog n=1 Tax=Nannospalax galili TaxID=1026970 RepID=UPI0004ED502B|nr:uncharacterized protein C16orf78 homolog [Nannospalax galili]
MSQDLKDLMPTERKSTWRTAKERRISDLTWVLEWLERRQGKKKHTFQGVDGVLTERPLPAFQETSPVQGVDGVLTERPLPAFQETSPVQGVDGVLTEWPLPAFQETSPVQGVDGVLTERPLPAFQETSPVQGVDGVLTEWPSPAFQKQKAKDEENAKANEKAEKRGAGKKQERDGRKVAFSKQLDLNATRKQDPAGNQSKLFGADSKGKHSSMLTSSYNKGLLKKSDLDIKDVIALESNMRPSAFRRQSSVEPVFQDAMFGGRRGELLRDWTSKVADTTYERKLKSLMEKGTEPKIENAKMLKPEEVLSCRYLRLSKNNIRTLIKLCKDAGLNVDIHPHMVEAEIDSKKVFNHHTSVSL